MKNNNYYDGQEVTVEEVRNNKWILDNYNSFMGVTTYYNQDYTLGVSFYDGYNKGTIFRAE